MKVREREFTHRNTEYVPFIGYLCNRIKDVVSGNCYVALVLIIKDLSDYRYFFCVYRHIGCTKVTHEYSYLKLIFNTENPTDVKEYTAEYCDSVLSIIFFLIFETCQRTSPLLVISYFTKRV